MESFIGKAVLVTTDKRGMFFGTLTELDATTATLTNVRNCLYWDTGMKGFLGLASDGPSAKCRIGPAAPTSVLFGVTSITECTAAAVTSWESAPWKS